MNSTSYKELVTPYYDAFEHYNKQQFDDGFPSELYRPIKYIMSIGGKRFRPICTLMAHHLFSSNWISSIPIAYAVEIFHNFTLLHDDIMDDSRTRRGHETVHVKYDMNSAILGGDNMLIKSYQYIYSNISESHLANALIKILTENGIKVCEGQALDVQFESRQTVSESEYIQMIQYKTAVLIGAAFQMGALAGGASSSEAQLLYDFGLNLGTSFQIIDDLLDTYGDESFGKKIGGDIIQGKKTLLYIKCQQAAINKDKEHLNDLYQSQHLDENKKLEQVHELFGKYQVKEACLTALQEYNQRALEALDLLQVNTDPLKLLCDIMLRRNI